MKPHTRLRALRTKLIGTSIATVGASLAMAAPAVAADTFFASPAAIGTGDCSSAANACTLTQAVEVLAGAGDEVILAPGDYLEGSSQLDLSDGETVHGAAGQPRPRILTTANIGVLVNAGILRRVEIEHTTAGGLAALYLGGGTAEQVVAHTTNSNDACLIQGDASKIRDSVCRNTKAASGSGLRVSFGGGTVSASARNVTAVATDAVSGRGLAVEAFGAAIVSFNATNVIADGPPIDVQAFADAAATAIVTLDHSNYVTEDEAPNPGGVATVTNPGSGTNQMGTALFQSAATGDFHQVFGSPTIDGGIGGAGLGTADLDGEARTQGALPDIGADEFAPPSGTGGGAQPADQVPAPKKCKKGQKLKKGKCVKKKKRKKR